MTGRGAPYLISLYLYVVHPVGQDQVDQLVAGVVGLGGQLVQLSQNVLPNADGYNSISVFASLFDNKGLIFHVFYLAIHLYKKYRLTNEMYV